MGASTDDLETMSLGEILELQEEISRLLVRRFQREVTLFFSDVVGSTEFFERQGDAAGRALVQRHHHLLGQHLGDSDGRVVDTAGDGAFCVFDEVESAARAAIGFQQAIDRSNQELPPSQHLAVRVGIHWGPALVDRVSVSGDSVNYASRICDAAGSAQVFLSEAAVERLPPNLRIRCRRQGEVPVKGISAPARPSLLLWLDPRQFPDHVCIQETDEEHPIPLQPKVRFGRLTTFEGAAANDVVLTHPDEGTARFISRWHFELERTTEGFRLHQLSRTQVSVDGQELGKGESAMLRPDSEVVIGDALLTLRFQRRAFEPDDATFFPGGA